MTSSPLPDSPELSRDELEKYAAALVEFRERKKQNPLFYFEPNPKAVPFFESGARVRGLAAGNRWGKSEHLVAEGLAAMLGFRPWVLRRLGLDEVPTPWLRPDALPEKAIVYNADRVRIQVPASHSWVTGLDAKKGIGETLWPKIQQYVGPWITKVYMSHAGTPAEFTLKNGSRGIFASATQQGISFEATNYASYSIDEPIPRRVYTGIRRGAVDQRAPICLSFTPLGIHAGWIFRDLYSRQDGKNVAFWTFSIFDNPWLSKEEIEQFASDPTIPEVEREARLYGRWMHLVDRIYPQFADEVHIIPDLRPPDDWIIGQVVDPHTVRPWAVAWFTVAPNGDIIFFREWPDSDFTKLRRDGRSPEHYAYLFRQIERDRPAMLRYMDPNYGKRMDLIRGVKILPAQVEMSKYGLHYQVELNDSLEYGEARVRSLLAYDTTQPVTAFNRPRIFFCESCRNLANAMRFYCAVPEKAENQEIPSELKRDETYKDFADLVRYVAVSDVAHLAYADSFQSHTFGDYDRAFDEIGAYGE